MDPDTGKIYDHEEIEKLSKEVKEKLIPIEKKVLSTVQGMNRKQRRIWAAKQRRSK